ncbi:MAG TPA: chemotaxis protein CheX, partial [bacterium]
MAFMYFDELEEVEGGEIFPYISQVAMSGVITGTVNILVTDNAARHLARNLIGIRDEDELYADTLEDALREFTNLVMGRTMTILNPAGPFDMDVPRLVEQAAPPEAGLALLTIDGALDEEPFRIVLQYQEKQQAA